MEDRPPALVPSAPKVRRSRFVTVIAWVGIVSGVLGSVAGCVFVLAAPSASSVLILASSVASLATSLGLRERREWARKGLIAVLAYTTAMSLIGALGARLPDTLTGQLPPEELEGLNATMRATMLVSALVMGAINGLIIAKLCTRRVRAEFGAEADT